MSKVKCYKKWYTQQSFENEYAGFFELYTARMWKGRKNQKSEQGPQMKTVFRKQVENSGTSVYLMKFWEKD